MRFLFFIYFICLIPTQIYANDLIQVPKANKVKNTFSGDLSGSDSFHLIFTENKSTKKHEIFVYLFNKTGINEITTITSEEDLRIVSYYYFDSNIVLLLRHKKNKDNYIQQWLINTKTNTTLKSELYDHNDYMTSVRNTDEVFLVYKTDEHFKIIECTGFKFINATDIKLIDKDDPINTFFKNQAVSSVNLNEFVANGSTFPIRFYYNDGLIYITKNINEDKYIELLKINTHSALVNKKIQKFDLINEDHKRFNSFVNGHKLFVYALNKESASVFVYDLLSEELLNTLQINDDLIEHGKACNNLNNLSDFFKESARKKHIPTITANLTENGGFLLRLDLVDMIYSYNYDWWWHHDMMMQFQQQHNMMIQNAMNNIPGGPLNLDIDKWYYANDKDKNFIQFLVDKNGELIEKFEYTTIYNDLNKEHYIDTLDEIPHYKFSSSCFLDTEYRYIAYNKKLKGFIIKAESL